jgi:glycosyltransferase involved in cell wall biosynthesis
MRVLMVTQSADPFQERGGSVAVVRAMARGLERRGHQVTVLTADLGLKRISGGTDGLARGRWGWQSDKDSVETIYLPSWASYRSVTLNPGVFGFCRERLRTFDIVHIYGLYDLLGPVVAHRCRLFGVPYVVEPMGMFRPIVRNIQLKYIYRLILGGSMTRGARRFVATAPQERRELAEEGVPKDKIVVRRNGIEIPERLPARGAFRDRWCIPKNAQLVLFLGRLVSKKSPELLLEAFSHWQTRSGANLPAVLVLAGPDEGDGYREKLEAHVARLNLGSKVLFTGPLYGGTKWSAYCDADLFVLPSQNENFGITAAEAVACGTPVLVSDRCGIVPLIQSRAALAVPHELQSLSAGLDRLLGEERLAAQLKRGCAEVARELRWDEPLEETERLYVGLIKEGAGR